ncbi:unnamed protein product, partial [Adineta steineri]
GQGSGGVYLNSAELY